MFYCVLFLPRPALGPSSLQYSGYRVCFPGIKRPERGVDHPPLIALMLKKD